MFLYPEDAYQLFRIKYIVILQINSDLIGFEKNFMALSHVRNEAMDYLARNYDLEQSNAKKIYDDAYDLFHRLLTILDFNLFKSMDDKILSSLIIIIRENFELNDSYK